MKRGYKQRGLGSPENPFNANVMFGSPNNGWNQLGAMLGAALGQNTYNHALKRQANKLDQYIDDQKSKAFNDEIEALAQPAKTWKDNLTAEAMKGVQPLTMGEPEYKFEMQQPQQQSAKDAAIQAVKDQTMQGAINYLNKVKDKSQLDLAKEKYANLNPEALQKWAYDHDVEDKVLESRMPGLKKNIHDNITALMVPEIYNKLYNSNGNTATLLEGINQIDELAKYDPETAEQLRVGIPTGGAMFQYALGRNDKLEDEARALQNQKDMADYTAKLARQNAQYSSARGGRSGGSSGGTSTGRPQYRISDTMYDHLVNEADKLAAIYSMADEADKPAIMAQIKENERLRNLARIERAGYAYGGEEVNNNQDVTLNLNYNDIPTLKTIIDESRAAGTDTNTIISELKKAGTQGEALKYAENYLGIEKPKPKKESSSWFPDWGASEETGIAKKLKNFSLSDVADMVR